MRSSGHLTILQDEELEYLNKYGAGGGYIVADPKNFLTQAVIFREDLVEVVPRQIGEVRSQIEAINDNDEALVLSLDSNFSW